MFLYIYTQQCLNGTWHEHVPIIQGTAANNELNLSNIPKWKLKQYIIHTLI